MSPTAMIEPATTSAGVHIFGIRHHGPGSARSLRQALKTLRPDCVLVEGPPDADELLPLLVHKQMKPPVAILVYAAEKPSEAVYYPFAAFSPEWQAIEYALRAKVPVRFMDLPQEHQLLIEEEESEESEKPEEEANGQNGSEETPPKETHRDPLGWLAEAAGFSDGERWWEHLVEHRRDGTDLFGAIREAMTALRSELALPASTREDRREAYMRRSIRGAQAEGYKRIAVVCGAWHAPALVSMPSADEDEKVLKGLSKTKVQATWVPWTHGRLTYETGYGAGIESPGWYEHLWTYDEDIVPRWLTRVARLLREEDLDASSAHLIETVRLAETLAALRGQPIPGLGELNEAIRTVLCFGDDTPMRLIERKLIVGEKLGAVPESTPAVPLQQDLTREQKRLKLEPSADLKVTDYDLRKPLDLDRSHLLHRLNLLGIPWGHVERSGGKKGTFHEFWRLQWHPEFAVNLIESGVWGNTILDATTARVRDLSDQAPDLPALTTLLDQALLAELPNAVPYLMRKLESQAALTSDVTHLMEALPPLANVLRYGDVRKTDTRMIEHSVRGIVARICVNLPLACGSLDDDAARKMFEQIIKVDATIGLLQDDAMRNDWQDVLKRLADRPALNGLIQGRACRLLLDAGRFDSDEAARRLSLALSLATEPPQAAAWIEGLLKGSGLVLLHDEALWNVLDEWIGSLSADAFLPVLPLVRRTFSSFAAAERRQMGERARRGGSKKPTAVGSTSLDVQRAEAVLPMVATLLGLVSQLTPSTPGEPRS